MIVYSNLQKLILPDFRKEKKLFAHVLITEPFQSKETALYFLFLNPKYS